MYFDNGISSALMHNEISVTFFSERVMYLQTKGPCWLIILSVHKGFQGSISRDMGKMDFSIAYSLMSKGNGAHYSSKSTIIHDQ